MTRSRTYSWVLLLLLALSCGKNTSYEKIETFFESSDNVPVSVYVGDPYSGVTTRSSGSIESREDLSGKEILVWAFLSGDNSSYNSVRSLSDPAPVCLIDGKSAVLGEKGAAAEWTDRSEAEGYYFYPKEQYSSRSYDFSACYIDNANVVRENVSADSRVLALSINGRQDIMTSRATPPKNATFCYDYARSGVDPIFTLHHRLVKIQFRVKPGVIEGREPKEVSVSSLKMEAPTLLHLTVARKNLGELTLAQESSSMAYMDLHNGDDSFPLNEAIIRTFAEKPDEEDEKASIVELGGESAALLLPEAESYRYIIGIRDATDSEDATEETRNVLRYKKKDGTYGVFEGGKSYMVTFEIFGASDVAVTVEMVPWVDGDPISGSDDEIEQGK